MHIGSLECALQLCDARCAFIAACRQAVWLREIFERTPTLFQQFFNEHEGKARLRDPPRAKDGVLPGVAGVKG